MCEHEDEYISFPIVAVGGTVPGSYVLRTPLPSNADFAEFAVICVSNAGTASTSATVSGSEPQSDPTMVSNANNAFTDQSFIRGAVYRAGVNGVVTPPLSWERIVDPQGRIFVTLGTGGVGAPVQCYVSLKVRVKVKNRIPKPFVTVPPEHMETYNIERERRIQEAVLGHEGELIEYGQHPGNPGTTRELTTGNRPLRNSYRTKP